MDAGKPTTPAAAVVTGDKKSEAPKIDVKPMGVGAPKVDDKTAPKMDAVKPIDTKPADVKKQ